MIEKLKIGLVFVIVSLSLFGCATTTTTGQKLVAIEQPLNGFGVVLMPWVPDEKKTSNSSALYSELKSMGVLLPLLFQRIPLVLEANNIENKTILGRADPEAKGRYKVDEILDFQYVLSIVPVRGVYQNYGGHIDMTMTTSLFDRAAKKVIWSGTINFKKHGIAKINEETADEFARQLLVQLNKDGIVRLSTLEPKMLSQ
ncbi:hypothetical protein [Undibacterium sp.]|uniref:hypothetical protein n=1 Tax=Undibacterium sp. TaxID=1914977 RepID=UPI002B9CCE8D|nr:hypothetical protein [Undibacterium sp.]HTD06703.1 hypothetical protein [Undibacterium sp.]